MGWRVIVWRSRRDFGWRAVVGRACIHWIYVIKGGWIIIGRIALRRSLFSARDDELCAGSSVAEGLCVLGAVVRLAVVGVGMDNAGAPPFGAVVIFAGFAGPPTALDGAVPAKGVRPASELNAYGGS